LQSSFGLTLMVLGHLLEEGKIGNDTEDLGVMLHRFVAKFMIRGCGKPTTLRCGRVAGLTKGPRCFLHRNDYTK